MKLNSNKTNKQKKGFSSEENGCMKLSSHAVVLKCCIRAPAHLGLGSSSLYPPTDVNGIIMT